MDGYYGYTFFLASRENFRYRWLFYKHKLDTRLHVKSFPQFSPRRLTYTVVTEDYFRWSFICHQLHVWRLDGEAGGFYWRAFYTEQGKKLETHT